MHEVLLLLLSKSETYCIASSLLGRPRQLRYTSIITMEKAQLTQLKGFVEALKKDPDLLHSSDLSFFADYIKSLGGKLPEKKKKAHGHSHDHGHAEKAEHGHQHKGDGSCCGGSPV